MQWLTVAGSQHVSTWTKVSSGLDFEFVATDLRRDSLNRSMRVFQHISLVVDTWAQN